MRRTRGCSARVREIDGSTEPVLRCERDGSHQITLLALLSSSSGQTETHRRDLEKLAQSIRLGSEHLFGIEVVSSLVQVGIRKRRLTVARISLSK